jgi:drug/metabolite transporter (DMT)-like permease
VVFLGERFLGYHAAGILLTLFGVTLVSLPGSGQSRRSVQP